MTNVPEILEPVRPASMPNWLRYGLIALCLLAAIFGAGVAAGFTQAELEHGFSAKGSVILALIIGAALVPIWGAWRLFKKRGVDEEPVAPRVQKSRKVLILSCLVGGAIGLLLAATSSPEAPFETFSNSPISPLVAAIVIAAWVIVAPLLSYSWLRSIDEHEAQANHAGALAGVFTYLILAPTWWLGWRGGFLPEPQTMINFTIVSIVYASVWLWRKRG